MPITILSPYSGRSVKVRDQDLERALRDEEGRIFYVVQGTDEKGYYASMTRKGSEKDQQRYRALEAKGAVLDQQAKANVQQMHDATGKKRRNPVGIVVMFLILAALALAGYAYFVQPQWLGLDDQSAPANQPTDPQPNSDEQSSLSPQSSQSPQSSELLPTTPSETTHKRAQVFYAMSRPPVRIVPAEFAVHDAAGQNASASAETETPPATEADADADADAKTPTDRDTQPAHPRTWRPRASASAGDEQDLPTNAFEDFRVNASGLRYKTTHLTDGAPALAGCYLEVRYAAYDLDGKPLIDDATQRFVLMTGKTIRALDEGLAGMRGGEQRVIFVPKGHSTTGELPGIDELPDQPFVLDVQLDAVRPGITYITETHGKGEPALPGDSLTLTYHAWVEGKTKPFDSSELRGRPMTVTLGEDAIIPGLELGISGMQPGETRLITIPPYLAYGNRETAGGLIPPNSVLTFRVTAKNIDRPD